MTHGSTNLKDAVENDVELLRREQGTTFLLRDLTDIVAAHYGYNAEEVRREISVWVASERCKMVYVGADCYVYLLT